MIRLAIHLERLTLSLWISVFIPSMCLILAAEITLFIDDIHFEATIMVALTSNLVMYTLYNTIQEQLPPDSNLKLIDAWVLHGLTMPMVVFTILAINELMKSQRHVSEKKDGVTKSSTWPIQGAPTDSPQTWVAKQEESKSISVMKVCKILVPTISVLFMAIFFGVGLAHQNSTQG